MHSKMEHLFKIPDEFIQPVLPCFELLRRSNIELFEEEKLDRKKKFEKRRRSFFTAICVGLYQTSLTMYLREMFRGAINFAELAYAISVYVVCTQTIFKTWIVVSNIEEIKTIIHQLGNMWRTEDLTEVQIDKKNVLLKRLKFCYTVFYWMNLLGSWQYMLCPLFETIFRRYILKQESALLLPFYCKFPFDTGSWTKYIFAYIFEIYSMLRIVYCYLGTEFLMITLCSHLATEFTLLQDDLLNIKPWVTGNFNELQRIITRHQKLLHLTKQLNRVFNKMIFVNLSSTHITICFFGLSAKVAQGVFDMANNFVAVIVLILPIFNLCYYSELLSEASTGIAVSAYSHLWYKGNIRYQKLMWLIIRRSQVLCSFSSIDDKPIGLHTFSAVLSTTWSYFSLISSLYEDEG